MGPRKGLPGTAFIKKSWKAAKEAMIFQAVAEPRDQKKTGSRQKAEKEPSRAVAVYQNINMAGGHKVRRVKGSKKRWMKG